MAGRRIIYRSMEHRKVRGSHRLVGHINFNKIVGYTRIFGGKMKVNLGGQKGRKQFPKGWVIVDTRKGADKVVDIADAPLPFNDNSVDVFYSSHTLEHIWPDRLHFVLSEVYRSLKAGGTIRVVVPDIDIAIRDYVKGDHKLLKHKDSPTKMAFVPNSPIYYLASWFFSYSFNGSERRVSGGHVNVFTKRSMFDYLGAAGFKNVVKMKFNKCSPIFKGCDFKRYANCSLYVECKK